MAYHRNQQRNGESGVAAAGIFSVANGAVSASIENARMAALP